MSRDDKRGRLSLRCLGAARGAKIRAETCIGIGKGLARLPSLAVASEIAASASWLSHPPPCTPGQGTGGHAWPTQIGLPRAVTRSLVRPPVRQVVLDLDGDRRGGTDCSRSGHQEPEDSGKSCATNSGHWFSPWPGIPAATAIWTVFGLTRAPPATQLWGIRPRRMPSVPDAPHARHRRLVRLRRMRHSVLRATPLDVAICTQESICGSETA